MYDIQTLKCTTTPENRSVQTVQRSVHRSNRSVQTVQRSVHRSVQTVQRSVQSVPIVQSAPPFGTPSVSHLSKFRVVDRSRFFFFVEHFRKTIKMLWLIISVYLYVYVLEGGKVKVK
jgi:hypothetical protein